MFRSKLSYWMLAAAAVLVSGAFSAANAGLFQNTLSNTFTSQITVPRSAGTPSTVFEEFVAGPTTPTAKLDDL